MLGLVAIVSCVDTSEKSAGYLLPSAVFSHACLQVIISAASMYQAVPPMQVQPLIQEETPQAYPEGPGAEFGDRA